MYDPADAKPGCRLFGNLAAQRILVLVNRSDAFKRFDLFALETI